MGGAERVCLKTIEALKERGHEVILNTIEPTNWNALTRIFGPCVRPHQEHSVLKHSLTSFRFYYSMLSPLVQNPILDGCDSTICTIQELMLLPTKFGYMHYLPPSAPGGDARRNLGLLYQTYSVPFKLLQGGKLKGFKGTGLLCNSLFTQAAVRRVLHFDSTVVFPPVETNRFRHLPGRARSVPGVVAIGRFSPEKNFEFILDLAESLPTVHFTILGSSSGFLSRSYYSRLIRFKLGRNLLNVTIVCDPPARLMSSILSSSNMFVSATLNETFGLAVVEAMASGLIPVVHHSGGPWEDILDQRQGEWGFSYRNATEAAEIISSLVRESESMLNSISSRCIQRANDFSEEVYKSRIAEHICR